MTLEWKVGPDDLVDLVKNRDSGSIEEVNSKKWGGAKGMAKKLKSNLETGLSTEKEGDFADRIAHFGTNVLPKRPPRTLLSFWWEAIQDKTLIILMIAAVVSIGLGVGVPPTPEERSTGWIEGTAILIAVFLVSTVTAVNDWSKDKKFQQLSDMSEQRKINVIRDGKKEQISTTDIYVGDIVCLETGDYIPADLLYISGQGITVDESSMTGETDVVAKKVENPYFLSGCSVMEGFARGIVIASGANSEWGRLKALLEKPEQKTPLQVNLEILAENIGKIGLIMAAITFVALIIRWGIEDYGINDEEWDWSDLSSIVQFAIIAITIVVVAVPEGLPLAVTLSLAFSMMKMMKDQNLVRHLAACETMGGATNICSDKTGTLTQNQMTVVKLWLAGKKYKKVPSKAPKIDKGVLKILNEGIGANSTAYIQTNEDGNKQFIGAKTECALLMLEEKFGSSYDEVRATSNIVRIFPFSSKKKRMSAVVKTDDGYICYCKGASEVILAECIDVIDQDGNKNPLTSKDKEELMQVITEWASEGLRTLTLGYRELPSDIELPDPTSTETPFDEKLTLIAIVGIEDPLRDEVKASVKECHGAGITVRMLTGDNILTAKSIGTKCGIFTEGGIAIEGPDFRKMSVKEMDEIIPKLQIIARCSPEDKLILVRRLKELGEVVAVTGDGTNDSPALREADVGFAMGISGTEVAKGACDIVLLDDNFSSIEKAVMWGRNVYDSIRKFLQFQLTVNVVAVIVAFIGAVSEGFSPLTAVQLLWVNLIMDTMAALALATEAPTMELLNRPPHGRFAPLITFKMWRMIALQSALQLFVCFFILYGGNSLPFLKTEGDNEMKGTLIFNTFVFLQIFNEINCRKLDDEKNIFKGIHRNYIFIAIFFITVIVQVLLVQFGGDFSQTKGLDGYQWLFCILVGALSMPFGVLIRFIPTPSDKYLERKNKAAQDTVELDDIKVEDENTPEERKSLKMHSESREGSDSDSESKPESEEESEAAVIKIEEEERRPRSASQNWKIAKQAVVKVGVISAFRRPIRGVQI